MFPGNTFDADDRFAAGESFGQFEQRHFTLPAHYHDPHIPRAGSAQAAALGANRQTPQVNSEGSCESGLRSPQRFESSAPSIRRFLYRSHRDTRAAPPLDNPAISQHRSRYRKASLAQWGCERQKTQRRTQRRSVVRRIKQHHFAPRQQLASSAGSSRFASTAGFMRDVLLFSLLLSHNSTGAAYTSWSRRQRAGIEIAF